MELLGTNLCATWSRPEEQKPRTHVNRLTARDRGATGDAEPTRGRSSLWLLWGWLRLRFAKTLERAWPLAPRPLTFRSHVATQPPLQATPGKRSLHGALLPPGQQAPGSGQCPPEPPTGAAFVSVTPALTEGTERELTWPFILNARPPLGVPMGTRPWEVRGMRGFPTRGTFWGEDAPCSWER